jgi:outer membrane protein insertion porin family
VKNKIAEIDFIGNEKLSDKLYVKQIPTKKTLRMKASKFIKAKYKTDLEKVIASYKEKRI